MEAILFDLDGTLIDSVPMWVEASVRELKTLGHVIDPQMFLTEFYQKNLHYRGILERCGIDTKFNEEFYRNRDNRFAKLMRTSVQWIDGAEDALKKCGTLAPLGLMTGSKIRFVKAMERRLHLANTFRAIITFEQTGFRMKPDPYGLQLLTQKLQVIPSECIYIGDQPIDVLAAHAAGMACCIVPREETPDGAAEGADFVVHSIRDVPIILEGSAR